MAKKIQGYIKLQIEAGKANPSPPVGPALGQQGVNIMEFCKSFNDKTKGMEAGMPIPVMITVYQDKSFDFITKTPPASYFLKKFVGIKSGSSNPGRDVAGTVTREQLQKVAEAKMEDLNAHDIEVAIKIVAGSATSMGLKVEG